MAVPSKRVPALVLPDMMIGEMSPAEHQLCVSHADANLESKLAQLGKPTGSGWQVLLRHKI